MFEYDLALRLLGTRLKDRALIGPETVQIDLTDNCTSNCIGCWARSPFLQDDDHYDTLEKGALDTDFVLNLLPELAGMGVSTIFLGGGGDPLCHEDFLKIVRRIKKLGFSCVVNTNLLNADSKMMETLVEVGLDELIVSIWAADSRMYSKLHPNQSEGTFLHIENMLRRLADLKKRTGKAGPKVKIYNVICSLNADDIPAMINHGKSLGVEEVEFSILDPIPRRTMIFLLTPRQINKITEFFKTYKQQERPFVHYELFLRRLHNVDVQKGVYDNGIVESIPCVAGWFYARVTTVGQVHSCLKAHRVAAGNLTGHRFGQIWFGEGQDRFRKNTIQLKYDNPFLEMIGHDIDFALPGCYRICDNLGYNQQIMRIAGALSPLEGECLDAMEIAAKDHATKERLKAIYADFAQREFPKNESEPGTDEKTSSQLQITIGNLAKGHKIIKEMSGKSDQIIEDFSFTPVKDAHLRVKDYLARIKEIARENNINLSFDLPPIETVLKKFAQGLELYSENDLLRALGVVVNKALVGPRTFHLDVANGCNTDCVYCWFHSPFSKDRVDAAKFDSKWRKELMPFEMFKNLVDDLEKTGCKEDVVLSGKGEPLIHPKIIDMVKYLKKKEIFTTLFTNGLLLDEDISRACVKSELDLLYISLSAASEKVFDSIQTKPSSGAFSKVIKNINRLIQIRKESGGSKPEVVLVDVVCNRNNHEVTQFARLAVELGVDHLRYQLAAIEPYNQTLALNNEQIGALLEDVEKGKTMAEEGGVKVIANIDAQLEKGRGNWSGDKYLDAGCLAGWTFARAWADGVLSFCCSPKPLGDLKKTPFIEAWFGQKYETYRLAGKNIAKNRDLEFDDGALLWNDICTRCPNYEGIDFLEKILQYLDVNAHME